MNITIKGPDQLDVADFLENSFRDAIVSPKVQNCIVVCDKYLDDQDVSVMEELSARLSKRFSSPVISILNHDDDLLYYQLYENGDKKDEYISNPAFWDGRRSFFSKPKGGDVKKLCSLFNPEADSKKISKILKRSVTWKILSGFIMFLLLFIFREKTPKSLNVFLINHKLGYTFEVERHEELCKALGIPDFAAGFGYRYFANGEVPMGLIGENFSRTVKTSN